MTKLALPAILLLMLLTACGDGSGGVAATPQSTGLETAGSPDATPDTPATTASAPTAAGTDATAPSPTRNAGPPTPAAALTVELSDFAITPSFAAMQAGPVTVTVTNTGAAYHSLLFIKTDLAPEALPTDEDGAVDETADGIEIVDEVFEMPSGDSDLIETELEAGAYLLVCNVVDEAGAHFELGMRASFTVG